MHALNRWIAAAVTFALAAGVSMHVPAYASAGETEALTAEAIPETTDATIEGFEEASTAGSMKALSADVRAGGMVAEPVEAPMPFSLIGFDVPEGDEVSFRTSLDGVDWTAWHTAELLEDGPDGLAAPVDGKLPTSPVWVGPSRWLQISAPNPGEVTAHLIDSLGQSGRDNAPAPRADAPVFTADAVGQPDIISRGAWGANESITGTPSVARSAQHAVVHHTATTNDYTATQAAAIVRSIHHYHTATQGWSDIGYNFLVDKYGRIYEGRRGGVTKAVIGAHARGFNTGSIGVSLIGNHNTATPTAAAQTALRQLLAWKLSLHGIDPTATVTVVSGGSPKYASGTSVRLPAINGHRDTGQTSCPGTTLYPLLANLRTAVKTQMAQGASGTADYARQCRPEGDPDAGPVSRAKGENRIATAIAATHWYWASGAETAVIANAYDFPDALAAGALAATYDAPLLLTNGDSLHAAVATRLQQMDVKRAFVMGGPVALSQRVVTDLQGLDIAVTRVAGPNRYATAATAARAAGAPGREVTLALGSHDVADRAWPDALAAGALVATPQRMPTLLTKQTTLPEETIGALRDLNAETVWILGGTGAVSAKVEQRIADLGMTVRRLAGKTRYGTSAAAATEARRRQGATPNTLVLASGADFPDALAGAAVAAERNATLLLIPPCGLEQSAETVAYLNNAGDTHRDGVVLGSTAAASDRVRWQIGLALMNS